MSPAARPVIMVLSDYYLPGYKSGGGMRTIVNMVERLGHKYDFRIATRDHDGKLDRTPYDSVRINDWNQVGLAKVFYLSKKNVRISTIRHLVNEVEPDALYTNSFFSTLTIYLVKLRKLGSVPKTPVVIAPCGELSKGALALKSRKKRLFMTYAALLRLYRDVIWKVSGEEEAEEVQNLKLRDAKIFIAPDLTSDRIFEEYDQSMKPVKKHGSARFVFSSRFVKKKNFNWLLPLLKGIRGEVKLDVIAPIEDKDYWRRAQDAIAALPAGIDVRFVGSVEHKDLFNELAKYHFFICPTLGENFGHIFLEAMSAGCPVVISDRTPWKGLEDLRIGWDIPLESPEVWKSVIQKCVDMNGEEYRKLSEAARAFSVDWVNSPDILNATERVLDYSVRSGV